MAINVEQLRQRPIHYSESQLLPIDEVRVIVQGKISNTLDGTRSEVIMAMSGHKGEYQQIYLEGANVAGTVDNKRLQDVALSVMKDDYGMDESNYVVVYDEIEHGVRRELRDYPTEHGVTFLRELESDPSDPNVHYRLVWTAHRPE